MWNSRNRSYQAFSTGQYDQITLVNYLKEFLVDVNDLHGWSRQLWEQIQPFLPVEKTQLMLLNSEWSELGIRKGPYNHEN